MSFIGVLYEIGVTILSGLVLALIFFWLREKIYPLPEIDGRWDIRFHTKTTSYNPYKNMILGYTAMLWREGAIVKGSMEKVYENSVNGERTFEGTNRTRAVVDGYVEKRYFSRDRIILHVTEDGHGRESTTLLNISVCSGDILKGQFSSLVANQTGDIKFQRVPF